MALGHCQSEHGDVSGILLIQPVAWQVHVFCDRTRRVASMLMMMAFHSGSIVSKLVHYSPGIVVRLLYRVEWSMDAHSI